MAPQIRVLDDALADQIAAGEVVERPSSVVKELLENAIDAGAKRVQVEIEGGGCTRIRVTDDGHGMSPADAALSVRRHATSKLSRFEDLQAIATLGFRGEALPSIASVSRFALTTCEPGALSGTRVEIDGGGAARVREIGSAPGSSIEARDLFFNVPARLKFLKSRATESGHVASVCTRAALTNPELGLTLLNDGRSMRRYLPAASFVERARAVFEDETLVELSAERGALRFEAALGAPERARSGALGLHLLVNGRPVRDPALARAVAFAYGSVLAPGRYPVGALHLHLPPDQVDVNAHPQKLEVRFRDGRSVFDELSRLLAKQLGTSAWSGPARRDASYWDDRLRSMSAALAQPGSAIGPSGVDARETAADVGADPWGLASGVADGESQAALPPSAAGAGARTAPAQASLLGQGFFGALRVLGQVRLMLLVCEGHDALYVIDQHAADERIRFDRLKRAHTASDVKLQQLLFPERVQCTEVEAALVEAQQPALLSLGLDCSLLGPTTIAVRAVPALLTRAAPERLVRDVLAELERSGARAFSSAIDRVLATMACHGAIRAGDPLSIEQAHALLRNLDEVSDFAGHCPHGRPVVHSMPLAELEHKLGR